jgi:hypothetical protein
MEPTNDHERVIAKAVDDKFLKDPGIPYMSIIPEIAVSLGFLMSASDTQFLVRYAQWRTANSNEKTCHGS